MALIERLYTGLDSHDGEAMAACYAPQAVFEDPAFGELRDGAPADMWRMLTGNAKQLDVTVLEREADDRTGTAVWEAHYKFAQTGRDVVNTVHSRFVFEGGLIVDQRDSFDLRAWAAQALGPAGKLLGLTPLLGPMIRRRTAGQLAAYRAGA